MRVSAPRVIVFLSVLGTVSALLHGYAWLRVGADPMWPAPIGTVLTLLFATLSIALPLAMIGTRALESRVAVPLAWGAYVWLGTLFYLDVALLALDGTRLVFENVAHASALAPWVNEGSAGARALAAAAVALTLGLVTWGVTRGLAAPDIRRVHVKIAGLPPSFEGFRIVQLTDVHVGPLIRRRFVESLVERVHGLEPDLIAITGDLVDGSVSELASEVAPLAELKAPHGVRFVTGNHELFSGVDAWVAHLETLGLDVLRNRHVVIEKNGQSIVLAGIDDAHSPRFGGVSDLAAALRDRPPGPVVLLAHQPRGIDVASRAGVALQISGHTHGGQMQPFGALVRLEQPFLSGLHRVGDAQLWVSEGTGTWGPPLRIGTRSEISVIELHAA
ncbi:MAG: metallophosphoesterase [Deltaproteobacteria bacterium]|nr:metallophosphoesterase [Deltaproteobacteria bacterium]